MNKIKNAIGAAFAAIRRISMRTCAAFAVALGFAMSAMAEGSTVLDGTSVTAQLTQLKEDFSSIITAWLPVLMGIIGAGLVIWLVVVAVRLFKKFSNKAVA